VLIELFTELVVVTVELGVDLLLRSILQLAGTMRFNVRKGLSTGLSNVASKFDGRAPRPLDRGVSYR